MGTFGLLFLTIASFRCLWYVIGRGGGQVFAHASVALAMATVEGRLIESNLQFEALSGHRKDELKQLTLLSLTAPSDLQETFQ